MNNCKVVVFFGNGITRAEVQEIAQAINLFSGVASVTIETRRCVHGNELGYCSLCEDIAAPNTACTPTGGYSPSNGAEPTPENLPSNLADTILPTSG